jgi:hypothetical protein
MSEVNDEVARVVARLRAAIRMLYPEEMTPTAKRMLDSILEEEDQ